MNNDFVMVKDYQLWLVTCKNLLFVVLMYFINIGLIRRCICYENADFKRWVYIGGIHKISEMEYVNFCAVEKFWEIKISNNLFIQVYGNSK